MSTLATILFVVGAVSEFAGIVMIAVPDLLPVRDDYRRGSASAHAPSIAAFGAFSASVEEFTALYWPAESRRADE